MRSFQSKLVRCREEIWKVPGGVQPGSRKNRVCVGLGGVTFDELELVRLLAHTGLPQDLPEEGRLCFG